MIDTETFRQLALALPNTNEQPHFEKTSFRVGSKIFATLDLARNRACLLFTVIDQSVFCAFDKSIIYPVPNKWGQKGATFVELNLIAEPMLKDALEQAYNKIIAKK